jgi:hypothetical protein
VHRQVTGVTLPSPASPLSRAPRIGRPGGEWPGLSWLIRASWLIRCTIDPPINRITRLTWLVFADALAVAAIALADLTAHEATTEKVVHQLVVHDGTTAEQRAAA